LLLSDELVHEQCCDESGF